MVKTNQMPHIKNALIRYRIIDKALRNDYVPYPSKQDLRLACEENLFGSADGMHICDSTIEKDLFAMRQEYDAPIKYCKKNKGYHYTDKEFSINETPLSPNDIQSIKFAADTLAQFKDAEIFQEFGFALNKIVDKLNVSASNQNLGPDVFIQFETGTVNHGGEFLPKLLSAIKNKLIVFFDYSSFISGQRKKRKVLPLLLKEYRNRWYLICYDFVKEDVITYGLDRMYDLEVTDQIGESPKNFNPDLFFKFAIGITANNALPSKVKFKASSIAAKYIESQPFHQSQKMISEDENCVFFEMFVAPSEELYRNFLSYGGDLVVTSPPEVQAEMKRRTELLFNAYQ